MVRKRGWRSVQIFNHNDLNSGTILSFKVINSTKKSLKGTTRNVETNAKTKLLLSQDYSDCKSQNN